MKKYFFLFFSLLCFFANAHGQINILQNSSTTPDPNEYFINGISTREDIGGVDIEFVTAPTCFLSSGDPYPYKEGIKAIKLTNYNDFPTTVLLEYEYTDTASDKYVITATLPPARIDFYPSKEIVLTPPPGSNLRYWITPPNVRSITRRVGAHR